MKSVDFIRAIFRTSSILSSQPLLTCGFQILYPIQAGAPSGLSTCTLSPVNARAKSLNSFLAMVISLLKILDGQCTLK